MGHGRFRVFMQQPKGQSTVQWADYQLQVRLKELCAPIPPLISRVTWNKFLKTFQASVLFVESGSCHLHKEVLWILRKKYLRHVMADIHGSYFAFIKQSLTWHLLRAKHCFTSHLILTASPWGRFSFYKWSTERVNNLTKDTQLGITRRLFKKKKNRTVGLISRCYNLSCKCRWCLLPIATDSHSLLITPWTFPFKELRTLCSAIPRSLKSSSLSPVSRALLNTSSLVHRPPPASQDSEIPCFSLWKLQGLFPSLTPLRGEP